MTQDKLTRDQLADIIKAKYPQYSEMDNSELVDKIVAKYPVYNDQLIEEDLLKKKDAANMDSELVDGSWCVHYCGLGCDSCRPSY